MNSPFKASPFSKKATPKTFVIDPTTLVNFQPLQGGREMPLVASPNVKDLNLLTWLKSERASLIEKLYKHGAILFRGFQIPDVEAFESMADILAGGLFSQYGDLPKGKGKIYGVTPYPEEKTILFHNESSHMHRWPLKQFFYCEIPASSGGETPVVDCRAFYKRLDPQVANRLEKLQFRYMRNFISGVDVSWMDFFKTDDRNEVETYCRQHQIHFEWKGENDLMTYQISPAITTHPFTGEKVFFNQIQLHHIGYLDPVVREALLKMFPKEDLPRNVYYGNGEDIEESLIEEISTIFDDLTVKFPWQQGDVLMVDNMLVAHGRLPYTPPRKMHVAMGDMYSPQPASI